MLQSSSGTSGFAQRAPGVTSSLAMPSHILIFEEDAPLRTLLGRLLRECGYDVTGVADGKELAAVMAETPNMSINLVLLDIELSGEEGLELCRKIREFSRVPIIIVSARGQEADHVAGLDAGADDYIVKPFGRLELLARIRAVLRRTNQAQIPPETFVAADYAFVGWRYNVPRRELHSPSGVEVVLTAAEHELLFTLLRNPHRTLSRERLLELSRNRIGNSSDRSIDVLVSRLRRKMGGARKTAPIIRTIRGIGYMFATEVEVN